MRVTLTLPEKERPEPIAESIVSERAATDVMVVDCRVVGKDGDEMRWSDGPHRLRFDTRLPLPAIEALVERVAPSANMLFG